MSRQHPVFSPRMQICHRSLTVIQSARQMSIHPPSLSTAHPATGLVDGSSPRGDFRAPGEDNTQVRTPPQWRRISAAAHSPPRREVLTNLPTKNEEGDRLRHNNQEYNKAHGPFGRKDTEYRANITPDRHSNCRERQAAGGPDRSGGRYEYRPNQRNEGGGYWRRFVHSNDFCSCLENDCDRTCNMMSH